jgi:hypothetical protein
MKPLHNVLVVAVLSAFAPVLAIAGAGPSATVAGTVTLTATDGVTFASEGARVTLACVADALTRTEVSDERGAFRFLNVPVDTCSIEADVQGFAAQTMTVVTAADEVARTDLNLGISPLRVGVHLGGGVPLQVPKTSRKSRRSDAGQGLERPAKGCTR